MGACRESINLWRYLSDVIKTPYMSRWFYLKRLARLRINDNYFWQDSFGRYLYRWLICPIKGHQPVWLDEGCDNPESHWYCFKCQRSVEE